MSYQLDSCLCQGKGLEMYTSDYMVASFSDFIMNLAKLNVFLKASTLLMKCELAHRCHYKARLWTLGCRGKVASVTEKAEKSASK